MQRLVASSAALAEQPELRAVANLRSIDCVAARLWFDRRVGTRFPANVLSGFDDSMGGTFFNLNDMQVLKLELPGLIRLLSIWQKAVADCSRLFAQFVNQES